MQQDLCDPQPLNGKARIVQLSYLNILSRQIQKMVKAAKKQPKSPRSKASDRFANVYRQFTRVKFTKYKLQFPRIRESEIINKIIKEWEALDEAAKLALEKQYIDRKGDLGDQDSSPPSDELKKLQELQKSQKSKSLSKKSKKKKSSPKVRVFEEKVASGSGPKISPDLKISSPDAQGEPGVNSPGKKSTPEKKSSSSELLVAQKTKGIVKEKKSKPSDQYLNFYKYYHQRLRGEHPRWTTNQITSIVKLLWKKKNSKKEKKQRRLAAKSLTGRQLYARTKLSQGYLRDQIKQLWKNLPFESKKYWQIKGQGKPHRSKKNQGKFVKKILNSGASKPEATLESSTYNWMNQPINIK